MEAFSVRTRNAECYVYWIYFIPAMKLRCCHSNQHLWSDRGIRSVVPQHRTSQSVWGQESSKPLDCLWKRSLDWTKNKLLSLEAHSKRCTRRSGECTAELTGLRRVCSGSFASNSQQTTVPVFVLWVPEGTGHFKALKRTALNVPQTQLLLIQILFLRN